MTVRTPTKRAILAELSLTRLKALGKTFKIDLRGLDSKAAVNELARRRAVGKDALVACLTDRERCRCGLNNGNGSDINGATTKASRTEPAAGVDLRNKLNDLTAREWLPETVSVWNQRGLGAGHPDARIERQHPAPFSFTDVSRLIRFFTKKGATVLDPFVGVGSTLKACALLNRKGIGIELNEGFARLARERLRIEIQGETAPVEDQQTIIVGDARHVVGQIGDESIDFLVTSPPYWAILRKEDHKVRQERINQGLAVNYGDDPRDLGTISDYGDFLKELVAIFADCARALKPGKYAAIIVSDFRHKSTYHMFHADLAERLKPCGLEMRGLTVLYQRHKKIYPYGYPYSFVPNVHNQFILILQKPKPEQRRKAP